MRNSEPALDVVLISSPNFSERPIRLNSTPRRAKSPPKYLSQNQPTSRAVLESSSTIMASRFFHGDSSSESSSSDEEELYSDKEEEEEASEKEDSDEDENDDDDDSSSSDSEGGKKKGVSKFLRDADSESEASSDDDVAKVVKSAKDKRLEELEGTVKAIENGQKINDWVVISAGMLCSNMAGIMADLSM